VRRYAMKTAQMFDPEYSRASGRRAPNSDKLPKPLSWFCANCGTKQATEVCQNCGSLALKRTGNNPKEEAQRTFQLYPLFALELRRIEGTNEISSIEKGGYIERTGRRFIFHIADVFKYVIDVHPGLFDKLRALLKAGRRWQPPSLAGSTTIRPRFGVMAAEEVDERLPVTILEQLNSLGVDTARGREKVSDFVDMNDAANAMLQTFDRDRQLFLGDYDTPWSLDDIRLLRRFYGDPANEVRIKVSLRVSPYLENLGI
jgi:hypothetical protein